ncbi:recombinase family protein [Dietzia natronolimnaea]|uniref:recombinase family protein n=1 Tax=Dietzia natronolimnaea TaxID=161920 RepID=UPI0015FE44A9|nr:recombinase family protein [Dietzia natronolimnaea]MBB1037366.1 recombinase family protein [Dietzia natronolimnaea]
MGRVIAYVRVSTDKQDLENQRHEIERYCWVRGLVVDEWDQDIASGTIKVQNRRVGGVLERLRPGDRLIVSEVSRISRSAGTLVNIIDDAVERGISIISVKENIEFDDGLTSTVMKLGLALAAELERKMISARTKEALARKRAEGVKLGRPRGTYRPEHRKLHGQDEVILGYMRKRVPKTVIARLLDTSVSTLRRYISDRDLDTKLLLERFRKTDV